MNMNIDRHNYEEFFLLYVDNELSPAERKAVEEFVAANTDLQSELELMKDAVLHPEPSLSFDFKASLMRSESEALITTANCETFFLLYADNELDAEQKLMVEKFVYEHPEHQANFELLQQVKLTADPAIVFPDKSSLYRTEKDDKVIPIVWWRVMAAAAVLLAVGVASWYLVTNNNNGTSQPPMVAQHTQEKPATTGTEPVNPVTDNHSATITDDVVSTQPLINKPADRQPAAARVQSTRVTDEVAAKTTTPQKKNDQTSNIPVPPNVTPIEQEIVIKNPPVVNQQTIEEVTKPTPNETVASLVSNASTTEQAGYQEYAEQGNSDIVFVANTSVSKKSKLRGVFRKASRFIEKATNLEPGSRGIRVANVEIALK